MPLHRALPEVTTSREEIASSGLSLEVEIDQFHLKEEGEVQEEPVEISDSKGKLDKASVARSPKLVVARVDPSSEEDEKMDLNPRRGLKDLLARRNKGSSSEKTFKSLVLANLPPLHPLPTTTFGLLPIPDLKKKRKVQEGEMVPQKGAKQPKTAKDKRFSLVDSREDPSGAEVHQQQHT